MADVAARTITDSNGRILLFSCEQFISDICLGECCFICGAGGISKPFDNEHVLPRWLLRCFDLFDKQIVLPNGDEHTYRNYQVPCCEKCNTHLGRAIETPVSELLKGGHASVTERLNSETLALLFSWLCLIFVKTHMKDRSLRVHRDRRRGEEKIADYYDWGDLHHIHEVARASYTGATFGDGVVGSMIFLPIDDPTTSDRFDWVDMTGEQTIALRVVDLGIIAVLNDACASIHAISHIVERIEGTLTTTQFRELAARMAIANSDLKNRPQFGTSIAAGQPHVVKLWTRHADRLQFEAFSPEKYGASLAFVLRDRIEILSIDGERNEDLIRAKLLTGRISFLLDGSGKFMRQITWEPAPE